jgi:hypothetical protein
MRGASSCVRRFWIAWSSPLGMRCSVPKDWAALKNETDQLGMRCSVPGSPTEAKVVIVAHFIEGLRQTNGLLVGVGGEQRFGHESPRGAEPEAAFA